MAFAAQAESEIVDVDTGCNCIVLINASAQSSSVTYELVDNSWIKTATAAGRLVIEGQGTIENDADLMILYRHCSTASVNLIPTHAITKTSVYLHFF